MLKSKDLFSFENHSDKTVDELPENGAVVHEDGEAVVAPIEVADDVVAAEDDIGQGTPVEEVVADDTTDLTSDETPLVDAATVTEIDTLTQAGEKAAEVKNEIVEAATAEVTGGDSADTDVNGNAITPEQAEVNEEEDEVEEEVDEEAKEEMADKDIHTEATEIEENADEQLGDVSTDDSSDGEATDDTSTDIDSPDGEGDLGMDAGEGGGSDTLGADDVVEEDDTPLEGVETETTDGDIVTDVETTEDTTEIAENTGDDLANEPAALGDLEGDASQDAVDKQVEAAEVTAQAASADANETDFIDNETPEQSGELSAAGIPEAGKPVVAEATPAVQVEQDVSTAPQTLTGDETEEAVLEEEDDTPLDVLDTIELTPTEVDGDSAIGASAPLETTEAEVVDETTEAELEEAAETEETSTASETDEAIANAEIETAETDEEENLEDGIIEIPDVDVDVTEEEVEEAEVEADAIEAEAEAEEIDGDDTDKTIEELQREAEALEEYRCLLEHGIANESYSPQLLGYVMGKSDHMRTVLQSVGYKLPAVSLEAYSAKDMDLAYQVSVESIRGYLSRIGEINRQLVSKVTSYWSKGLVDKVVKRTSALDKQIDLCLVQTKESSATTKEIKGIGNYLGYADGHLVKAVGNDLRLVTEVSGKGFKATETLQSNLVKALSDIAGVGTSDKAVGIVKKVAEFKDAKTAFPTEAFSKGFLGGNKLELKHTEAGESLKDKVINLGRRAVPVVVKSGKAESTTCDLSKGDIVNLLTAAKAYVALANKLAKSVGDRAVDNVSKLRTTRADARSAIVEGNVNGGDEAAIGSTAQALEIVAKAHNDLYKFITKHCIDTAEAICGVAKKFNK